MNKRAAGNVVGVVIAIMIVVIAAGCVAFSLMYHQAMTAG